MGFNKALLNINGRPLIRILIDSVRPLTERIIISSNDVSLYRFLDYPVIPDTFRNRGPLAGLHAVMAQENCSLYIVLACDLPNLQSQFLHRLVSYADGFDAVIPRTRDGVAHPLCALYRQTCFPSIQRALQSGANMVILTFLDESLAVRWIGPDEGQFKDEDLANLNTPDDLRKLGIKACAQPLQNSIYSS